MAVHGTRSRDSVSWDYAGLVKLLGGLCSDRTGLPVLRCYWYEATAERRRAAEHDTVADLPGVKLRLVRVRPGHHEEGQADIRRDLTTLARNKAISEAVVASSDADLSPVIAEVQDLGVRVRLIHISVNGNWTISRPLRQECDDIVEISGAHLRPFADLISEAEPARPAERYPNGYPAHSLANGNGTGHGGLAHQALPAALPAPPVYNSSPPEYRHSPQRSVPPAAAAPAGPGGAAEPALPSAAAESASPSASGPPPSHRDQVSHAALPESPMPEPGRARHRGLSGGFQERRPPESPLSGGFQGGHPAEPALPDDGPRRGREQQAYLPPGQLGGHRNGSADASLPRSDPQVGQYTSGIGAEYPHAAQNPYGAAAGPPPAAQLPSAQPPEQRFPLPQPGQPGPPVSGPLYPVPPAPPGPARYGGPPSPISMTEVVQAAHAEGFGFGDSVAREAPALWLEAVLARKPRMPSDLEARLLQGSALPMDSLLNDEVRHALRRGFWDALERSRR